MVKILVEMALEEDSHPKPLPRLAPPPITRSLNGAAGSNAGKVGPRETLELGCSGDWELAQ